MLDSNDLRQISEIVTTAVCASEERLENRIMVGVASLLEATVLPQLDDLHSKVKILQTDVTTLRTDVDGIQSKMATHYDLTVLRGDMNARFGTLCSILENKQVFTPADSQTVRQA